MKYSKLRRWLVWAGRIGRCRGFGVQSPWAYRMVRYVINEHWPYYAYGPLAARFPGLDVTERRVCELCLRLANYLQPARTVSCGVDGDALGCYVRAGCCRTVFAKSAGDGVPLADFAVIAPCRGAEKAFGSVCASAKDGCAVMLLFTLGEFLQDIALGKSRGAIQSMLETAPTAVTVVRGGEELSVKPEDVEVGETILVKPGEKVNLDGEIIEGACELDMAALTGESIPVSVPLGDAVLSGSVCINETIRVRVTKKYADGTIAQILDMLEHAQGKKSRTEKFITKFARIYTPIVCAAALLIIVVPPLFFGGAWSDWIYNGLSALVASCPCAIVISVPLGFFGGLGACSKAGILVKGSNYLEELTKCKTGVFDKTGTITSGKFKYVSCEGDTPERTLLGIIAACEKYSTHPIAKSIRLAFGQYADHMDVKEAKAYPGKGVSAVVDGVKYYAGNEKLMRELGVEFEETKLIGTAVYCATEDRFVGDIVFADIIKEDSKDAIRQLKKLGVEKTYMLTGDKAPIAADIAAKAGIDEYCPFAASRSDHSKTPDESICGVTMPVANNSRCANSLFVISSE